MSVRPVGILGLGLIGGSMAKAVAADPRYEAYGSDADKATVDMAIEEGVLAGKLEDHYEDIDILIVALYPRDVVDIISGIIPKLKEGCVIVDCTGIKSEVCSRLSKSVSNQGRRFVGGHPMAGKEVAGYENSDAELFMNASMILCKDEYTDEEALRELEFFFTDLGFDPITVTTPEKHDRVIAYTSQLAHVVSSAYIQSKTCNDRYGFSAGSFKDMTRVAKLNPEMWADLFLANRQPLVSEIDELLENITKYRDAIRDQDSEELTRLLTAGRIRKIKDEQMEFDRSHD